MILGKKIKAGALQFVLFIGVVIAILLLTFVILSNTHSFFGKKTELLIHTIKKSDLAMAYAMKANMVPNDTISLDLGLDDGIAVKGVKGFWGIFEKFAVVSTSKKTRFTKLALVGRNTKSGIPALYLKDNERPMIIVGNAKITGDGFLPKQGIRTGNISGNSYYNSALIYGKQLQSRKELPKLVSESRANLVYLSKNSFSTSSHLEIPLTTREPSSNSFAEPTKYINGDLVDLSGIVLTGNIIVRATRRIIVSASTKLQDVVLLAPEIIVNNNVHGTFQAIASKNIKVGKNCELGYPSALVVYDETSKPTNSNIPQQPNIYVDANTTIRGVVQYLGNSNGQFYYPQIKIDKGVNIIGEVYCEKNLELKGQVIGSVTSNAFMALENGSIYQNHLFNGTINSKLLSRQYVGLMLDGSDKTKAVAKWLY